MTKDHDKDFSQNYKNITYYIKLNLKNQFNAKNVNIVKIAKSINRSVPTIYRYLDTGNDVLPSIELLERMVDYMGFSLDEFLAESIKLSNNKKVKNE